MTLTLTQSIYFIKYYQKVDCMKKTNKENSFIFGWFYTIRFLNCDRWFIGGCEMYKWSLYQHEQQQQPKWFQIDSR